MTYFPVPSRLREEHANLTTLLLNVPKTDVLKDAKKTEIEAMDWTCSGERILVCSRDGALKLWKADKLVEERTWAGSWTWTEAHPTDSNLFAAVSWDGKVKVVDVRSPLTAALDADLKKLKSIEKLLFITYSVDGSRLAVLTRTDTIAVLDSKSGDIICTIQPGGCEVYSVVFDSTERLWIATGGTPGKILIYDTNSGVLLKDFVGHSHAVSCFARTRDNTCIVTGGSDALVALWDTSSNQCKSTFANSLSPVTSVTVNSDCSLIAWGSGAIGAKDAESVLSIAGLGTNMHYLSMATAGPVSKTKWHPTNSNVMAYCMQQGTNVDTSVQIVSW